MPKKILVTGGAGYIGSQTNFCLIENGFETLILDNLVYGHQQVVPPESVLFQVDLLNYSELQKVFESQEIEAVIHFAAFAYVGESVTDPAKYYRNNVVGTLNLLDCMRNYKVNKLVFSSTCATYGLPKNIPINENEIQNPINPYGRSKLMIEQVIIDFHKAYGLNAIMLRYFNACGADPKGRTGEWHNPETHLIPLILEVAAGKREKITIFGTDYQTEDGTCVRDYIHTLDLASAHILALKKLLGGQNICEAINLGTGQGYSVKEIVAICEQVSQQKITVEYGPRRSGDPDKLIADNTKAREFLGWKAEYSDLKTIVSTAWNWQNKLLSELSNSD